MIFISLPGWEGKCDKNRYPPTWLRMYYRRLHRFEFFVSVVIVSLLVGGILP